MSSIVLDSNRLIMLSAVKLNDDFSRGDIEIDNILSNYLLAMYHYRKILKTIIPKMPFLFCHVLAQVPGVSAESSIMCSVHSCLLLGNRLASVWGMKQAATKESM